MVLVYNWVNDNGNKYREIDEIDSKDYSTAYYYGWDFI